MATSIKRRVNHFFKDRGAAWHGKLGCKKRASTTPATAACLGFMISTKFPERAVGSERQKKERKKNILESSIRTHIYIQRRDSTDHHARPEHGKRATWISSVLSYWKAALLTLLLPFSFFFLVFGGHHFPASNTYKNKGGFSE